MLCVRGALTEILLEVTNDEIRSIAGETLSRNRLKGKVQRVGTERDARSVERMRVVRSRSALRPSIEYLKMLLYPSLQTVFGSSVILILFRSDQLLCALRVCTPLTIPHSLKQQQPEQHSR